jgi:hypothetical protein
MALVREGLRPLVALLSRRACCQNPNRWLSGGRERGLDSTLVSTCTKNNQVKVWSERASGRSTSSQSRTMFERKMHCRIFGLAIRNTPAWNIEPVAN